MKSILIISLFIFFIISCSETNKQEKIKIDNKFLKKLNHEQLDLLAFELSERNSIDSLRTLNQYRISKGNFEYYYNLAATYLELKDAEGIKILEKGAYYKVNNCLLALAMFYENGQFNLIKGGFLITPNLDSSIHYYTIAANNNDLQSQYSLGLTYYDQHMKDSSDKYLKMCINNNSIDESDVKGAALDILNRK